MGCGSSSLKGDAPAGVGAADDPAPRPVQKVATNFSSVNYDTNTQNRRQTEYAPHETEAAPDGTNEAVEHANRGVEQSNDPGPTHGGGEQLKPYHTIDGDEQPPPMSNGIQDDTMDPTSTTAKNKYATDNDPAGRANYDQQQYLNGESADPVGARPGGAGAAGGSSQERKKSWLGQKYQDYSNARDGKSTSQIPDEEMQKYTGKSKEEIREMMERGEGVGGGQSSSVRVAGAYGGGVGGASAGYGA